MATQRGTLYGLHKDVKATAPAQPASCQGKMTRMSIDKRHFSRALFRQRRIKGMTQPELAAKVSELLGTKVSFHQIARIETGDREARLSEAMAIATALNMPLGLMAYGGVVEDQASPENLAMLSIQIQNAQEKTESLAQELRQAGEVAARITPPA